MKFITCIWLISLLPVAVYSQASVAGKWNEEYRLFIPDDSLLFVKRAEGNVAVFTVKKEVYLDDGILKFHHCGIIDTSGNIIVPAVYDRIRIQQDSLFIVDINGLQGLTGKNGELVPSEYDEIGQFKDGIAIVRKGHRSGYINAEGKLIVPLEYDLTFDAFNGLLLVKKGNKTGLLNADGKAILFPQYQLVRPYGSFVTVMKDGKTALYTRQGKMLLGFDYDFIEEIQDDSIVIVRLNNECWLMNLYTRENVSKKYRHLFSFLGLDKPGTCRVRENGKESIIDKKGTILTERHYDRIGLFSEGLAPVAAGEKEGYIDSTGRLRIALMYDRVWKCQEGKCYVMHKGEKGFINTKGKWLFAIKEKEEVDFFTNGFAKIYIDKKVGFIDTAGKIIAKPVYRFAENFKLHSALVYTGDDVFYVNEQGIPIR